MRPQVTASMQTPQRLPVQVEPVGLSNLFGSLSVNENKYDLGKLTYCVTLPFLVSIGLVGKGRGPSEQGCQKQTFYFENFLPPLGLCAISKLEEVAWLFFSPSSL